MRQFHSHIYVHLLMVCFLEKTCTTISSTAIRSVPDVAAVHTASHFSVRQEAFDYIDAEFTRLTITSSKVNCMDSSRKITVRLNNGRISLNSTDKRLLETGKCLTDKHKQFLWIVEKTVSSLWRLSINLTTKQDSSCISQCNTSNLFGKSEALGSDIHC